MKYRVTLEFNVDETYTDDYIEEGHTTVESMANYAVNNNLSKYEDNICDIIGFPGSFDVVRVKEVTPQDSEVNDLWVYIKEFCDKFGRVPKDQDELFHLVDYVLDRRKPDNWTEKDEKISKAIFTRLGGSEPMSVDLQEAKYWVTGIKKRFCK